MIGFLAYERKPWSATNKLIWCGKISLVLFGIYLDYRWTKLSQSEMNLFHGKTRLYGDWRSRYPAKKIPGPYHDDVE